jgi:hypothetical protein
MRMQQIDQIAESGLQGGLTAGQDYEPAGREGGNALQHLGRRQLLARGKIGIAEIAGQIAARSPYENRGSARMESLPLDGMENLGDTEDG